MNKILLAGAMIATSFSLVAAERDNLKITPIVGFERVQRFTPTPHMKTRGIIGVGAVYKLPVGAAEAEYTHGEDISKEVSSGTSYEQSDDKVKLGLRGTASLGSFLSTYLRGGAQAKKSQVTSTTTSGTTTKNSTTKVNPYVGTGLNFHLLQFVSLNADVTAVYTPTSTPGLSDYEIQPSLGLSIRF